MNKTFRSLSAVLVVSALAAMLTVVAADIVHGWRVMPLHQGAGALAFILIGSAYISLQLSQRRRWQDTCQRLFLGVAFLLWGFEQFLSPGPLVTVMDSLVVVIFVADMSAMIVGQLGERRSKAGGTPEL